MFATTTAHAVTAGTDGTTWVFLAAIGGAVVVVTPLAVVRIARSGRPAPRPPDRSVPVRPDLRAIPVDRGVESMVP